MLAKVLDLTTPPHCTATHAAFLFAEAMDRQIDGSTFDGGWTGYTGRWTFKLIGGRKTYTLVYDRCWSVWEDLHPESGHPQTGDDQ